MNTSMRSNRFKHRLEYAGLRMAGGILACFPLPAALGLGWLLARAAFHLLRFRRKETLRRIGEVFPQSTLRDRKRVAWLSLRNICFNAVELMRANRYTHDWMQRHIENHGDCMQYVRAQIEEHGGVVLAVPHLGNWDLAGLAVNLAGIRIFSVAGVQRNRLVNDWINRQRAQGIDILDRGSSALRQIVKRLRGGEAFAILPDVRTRHPDLRIPFLGSEANLGRGMAQFARAANVPILPFIVSRIGWQRHRFHNLPAIYPDIGLDKIADMRRMTLLVMRGIEEAIRADPGQWFWYNKRWVLEPLDEHKTTTDDGTEGTT